MRIWMSKLKKRIRFFLSETEIAMGFWKDYLEYRKYQFHNPHQMSQNAYESKMLRHAHMIEKGLSLKDWRTGFGQEKIRQMLEYSVEYRKMGFPVDSLAYQNTVAVLRAYIKMQKTRGYENEWLNEKVEHLEKNQKSGVSAGIEKSGNHEMAEKRQKTYPEFFQSRHSIRQFSEEKIKMEDLEKAVRLAQKAPSACNRQPCCVYWYEDTVDCTRLAEYIAGNRGFEKEPAGYLVVTVALSAYHDAGERNQAYVDGGIFSMALMEALHYYGIGSCPLQNSEILGREKKIRGICRNIPSDHKIVLFLAVGYYKDQFTYAVSARKELKDVFRVIE